MAFGYDNINNENHRTQCKGRIGMQPNRKKHSA